MRHISKQHIITASRYIILCCFLLCTQAGVGQKKFSKKQFTKDSIEIMRHRLVRPQIRADNRQLLFKNQIVSMNGIDAGVMLKDKLRLTIGYRWLNEKLDYYKKTVDDIVLERHVKMQYVTLNSEFIYLNTRFFSLGMPLEIGIGNNSLVYKDENLVNFESSSGLMAVTDFGLSATFKPTRWIGVKGILGYQNTLFNGVKSFRFNGLFTSLGLNADVSEIIRDVKMFNLKRKYKRGNNLSNAVDLITD